MFGTKPKEMLNIKAVLTRDPIVLTRDPIHFVQIKMLDLKI
jgi:hypothetical protein